MSPSRRSHEQSQWPPRQADIPRPGEMAQVQRPTGHPVAFAGRPDPRHVPEYQLAPMRAFPPTQQHTPRGPAPQPMRLATLEPTPSIPPSFAQSRMTTIPVSALLSTSPPTSANQQISDSGVAQRQSAHAAAISSNPHQPGPGPLQQRYPPSNHLDQPPGPPQQFYSPPRAHARPLVHPSQNVLHYHVQQHGGSHFPSRQSPPAPEQAGSQYSPTSRSRSSAQSFYDSPASTSPRTMAALSDNLPSLTMPELPFMYELTIRQQPVAARACGFGERDRRVIDPPPILQLKTTDRKTGAPAHDYNAMFALHCTLLHEKTDKDETQGSPPGPDMQSTRKLMGTLVASPYPAKDEHNIAGTFFVFPDLSCRNPGKHRLHFKLLRIDPMNMQKGAVHGAVAHVVTDIFDVYPAKDFPGMRASSALLKALRRQGLNVGVKKGSEARKGKAKSKKDEGSESEGDESDGSVGEGGSGHMHRSTSPMDVSPGTAATQGKPKKRRRRDS